MTYSIYYTTLHYIDYGLHCVHCTALHCTHRGGQLNTGQAAKYWTVWQPPKINNKIGNGDFADRDRDGPGRPSLNRNFAFRAAGMRETYY